MSWLWLSALWWSVCVFVCLSFCVCLAVTACFLFEVLIYTHLKQNQIMQNICCNKISKHNKNLISTFLQQKESMKTIKKLEETCFELRRSQDGTQQQFQQRLQHLQQQHQHVVSDLENKLHVCTAYFCYYCYLYCSFCVIIIATDTYVVIAIF